MKSKKIWHGTTRSLGLFIEEEGLKAAGCEIVPEEFRKSCVSEPGYIYFTDSMDMAEMFACGTTEKVGLGNKGQIFEIDTRDVKVERDPLLPATGFRYKGDIPANKIKIFKIFECD